MEQNLKEEVKDDLEPDTIQNSSGMGFAIINIKKEKNETDVEVNIAAEVQQNEAVQLHSQIKNEIKPCSTIAEENYDCNPSKEKFPDAGFSKIRTDEKPHQCSKCPKVFKFNRNLILHNRIHRKIKYKAFKEKVKKLSKCKICNKTVCSSYLVKHLRIHANEKPFECAECHMRFICKQSLDKHMIVHEEERVKEYCPICNKGYVIKRSLTDHMKIHTRENLLKCSECDKEFTNNAYLNRHFETHTKSLKITLDTGSIQPANNKEKNKDLLSKLQDKKHYCQHCDKTFKFAYILKRHKRVYGDEPQDKRHHCQLCDKTFKFASILKNHMSVHVDVPTIKCAKCNEKFLNKRCLYMHEKTHESQEKARLTFAEPQNKMYDCQYCDKKFIFATVFATHMRSHAKIEIFSCSICDKKLSSKYWLNKHEKQHDNKEQPFCKICKTKSLYRSNSAQHMKTHTREKLMDSWANEVMRESMLKPHLNVHSKNEKIIVPTTAQENEQITLNSSLQEFQIILENTRTDEIDMVETAIDEDINPKLNEKIISHTSSEQTESSPQESLINEIKTKIRVKIEMVETAIVEHINTEICEFKIETINSTLSSDKCIEDTICKEEVILPDGGI